jgi:hypothetical protein
VEGAVSRAEQLLRRIIETEDAGLDHDRDCRECRGSGGQAKCSKAVELAKDSITALLAAKVWVDQKDGRFPAAASAPRRLVM